MQRIKSFVPLVIISIVVLVLAWATVVAFASFTDAKKSTAIITVNKLGTSTVTVNVNDSQKLYPGFTGTVSVTVAYSGQSGEVPVKVTNLTLTEPKAYYSWLNNGATAVTLADGVITFRKTPSTWSGTAGWYGDGSTLTYYTTEGSTGWVYTASTQTYHNTNILQNGGTTSLTPFQVEFEIKDYDKEVNKTATVRDSSVTNVIMDGCTKISLNASVTIEQYIPTE